MNDENPTISAMSLAYTQVPEGQTAIVRVVGGRVNFSLDVRGELLEDGTREAHFEVISGLPEKVMLGLLEDLSMLLEAMLENEEAVTEEVVQGGEVVELSRLLKSFSSDEA